MVSQIGCQVAELKAAAAVNSRPGSSSGQSPPRLVDLQCMSCKTGLHLLRMLQQTADLAASSGQSPGSRHAMLCSGLAPRQ